MPVIVFVCTGNTCRSPMAEAFAKEYFDNKNKNSEEKILKEKDLEEKDLKKLVFMSRGISVYCSSPAEQNAVRVMADNYNISLENHISKQLTEQDIEFADIIAVMTNAHKKFLEKMYPSYIKKIMTISELSGLGFGDIQDPFGYDINIYKECATILKKCIENIVHNRGE